MMRRLSVILPIRKDFPRSLYIRQLRLKQSTIIARNPARTWYKDNADPNNSAGKYAFQRLRHTYFTPHVIPKFKLRQDDKVYAIGSCFARGIESALTGRKVIVESAAPEFAKLQPANKEPSGLGFLNKYN